MTSTLTAANFATLEQELARGGIQGALAHLAAEFKERGQLHELFEALKMQTRHRLGLPLLYQDLGDELDPAVRNQLEDGLIAACREVGLLFFAQGRIREGWMYLRPVGNRQEAAAALAEIEVDDDNLQDVIDVALAEGVDPARGFALVLEHYGTCSSITAFETQLVRCGIADQRAGAAMLVRRLHADLLGSLKADIARQEGAAAQEMTLRELTHDREWLFLDNNYHIDTSHLAAAVRFARPLEEPEALGLALDLTEYGRRLSAQFQYPGDEPFADLYASHALYFETLLGRNVEAGLAYFRDKAESLAPEEHGALPAETLVELLHRSGRAAEALQAALKLLPGLQTIGVAPSILKLCAAAGDYSGYLEHCREHQDLLAFATALLDAQQRAEPSSSSSAAAE